jgi:hypothetical protein
VALRDYITVVSESFTVFLLLMHGDRLPNGIPSSLFKSILKVVLHVLI